MQQKLEEKDENTLEIKETFTSLQQEVDSKTKKLKKVKKKRVNKIQSLLLDWPSLQRFRYHTIHLISAIGTVSECNDYHRRIDW